jgi:phosphopantothenate synthetase
LAKEFSRFLKNIARTRTVIIIQVFPKSNMSRRAKKRHFTTIHNIRTCAHSLIRLAEKKKKKKKKDNESEENTKIQAMVTLSTREP